MDDRGPDPALAPLYFVCYARAERELVGRIEAKLAARRRRKELDVWRDVRNLDVWEQFTPEIIDVITRAAGAIVVVSDAWYASDYIQTHEWPAIVDRNEHDGSFGIFPLAVNDLDDDDPLRAHNLVNDLSEERLLGCSDAVRDTVLTRLSNQVGAHAHACSGGTSTHPPPPQPASATILPSDTPTALHTGEADQRPGLHHVTELPKGFVEPPELDGICEQVRQAAVTGITGIHGEGGTGKTVLAAAAARRLVDDFPGGVHWVTVGELATTEDVRRLQTDLLSSLGVEPDRPPRDYNDGKELLRAALVSLTAFVVVDDVWHPWQARAFDVVSPGGPARLLFTTRFPEVLPAASEQAEITRLALPESTAFLRRLPAGLPQVAEDLAAVLDAAGGLRLALAVLAATAQAEESWDPVLARLDGLVARFGRGDDASSAQKALHVAFGALTDADAERAWTLQAFPVDAAVPVSLLAQLWGMSLPEASESIGRLVARELLSGRGDNVEMHDHVHDFLSLEAPTPASDVHLRIWELAQARAEGDWRKLAEREPYLWDRLVWHASRAGLNSATLRSVVSDIRWLAARIRYQGAAAAEQDIRQVCDRTALIEGTPLRRMARVLRHGGLFDAISGDAGLDLSLECWAEAVGIERPGPRRLRSGSLPVPGAALLRTLRGHASGVRCVAFDPQGRRVATGSWDKTARVWDTETGEVLCTIPGRTDELAGVAFDPTGRRVATASWDGTARIWDPETGETLTTLTGHTSGVWDVAFDPQGRRIATASEDGTARIWDPETGETLTTLTGHTSGVLGVTFDPHGRRAASAGADGTARIWDPVTGESLTILTGHTSALRDVTFDPQGRRIASASWDKTARIWDPETGETRAILSGHLSEVYGVTFDPQGRRVATSSWDGTARIWDPETGETRAILSGHLSGVYGVAFDPQGRRVATAGGDGTARIWDPEIREALVTIAGHTSTVWDVALDPQGRKVATASRDGTARIWDAKTGQTLATLTGHTDEVVNVAFDPQGRKVATASGDGTARIWDAETGETLTALTGHTSVVWDVAFDPQGRRIATASEDGTARIWDPETGETLSTLTGHTSRVLGVTFDPHGRRAATAGADGTARIWNAETGQTLAILIGHTSLVWGVAFDPHGSRCATTSKDGTARIWNVETGEILASLIGHTSGVRGVAFDARGRRVATASEDGTARIWNTETGDCELTLALACSGGLAWHDDLLAFAAGWQWAVIELPAL